MGLDVGSGSVRALRLDAAGRARVVARRPLAPRRESPLRLVYDPLHILEAVSDCLRTALRRGGARAFGLAAQRSTFLIWQRSDGRPLTPAYGWQSRDGGSPASAAEARRVGRRTGLRWSPHYAGPRAAALLQRRPGLAHLLDSSRACLGTLDAFLLYRWSRGTVFRTDPTHAQRTLLYAPMSGGWDPRLLRRFGVPATGLPQVGPSAGFEVPLPGFGSRLTASCGDQQAALCAVRAMAPGAVLVNYGTGAFVLASCPPGARRPPGVLLAEAVGPGGGRERALEAPVPTAAAAFGLMGVSGAGGALIGPAVPHPPSPPGPGERSAAAPLLVAAVDGLGAPFWLDHAPSLLLFERPPRRAQALAVAEFAIAAGVHAALRSLRLRPARLVATGGLSARRSLLQTQADLARRPVERSRQAEWTALGAALLASGPERPRRLDLEIERILPSPSRGRPLRARYAEWLAAVRFLRSLGRRRRAGTPPSDL